MRLFTSSKTNTWHISTKMTSPVPSKGYIGYLFLRSSELHGFDIEHFENRYSVFRLGTECFWNHRAIVYGCQKILHAALFTILEFSSIT